MHGNMGEVLRALLAGAGVQAIPVNQPELVAEERELAEALHKIALKWGKFNEDGSGIWAGYDSPLENEVRSIGVKCANCMLYEGGVSCKIVAMPVAPEGKCRFAVIPDNVVKKPYKKITILGGSIRPS